MLPRLFTLHALRYAPAIVCLAMPSACGSHHVRLDNPDATPGARYACWTDVGCSPATADKSAELNPSETTLVRLPPECAGRIQQIVVLDAGSSKPEVHVTCAQSNPRSMDRKMK